MVRKKLNFDINNFKKFKDKISYIVVDKEPDNIKEILKSDNEEEKRRKTYFKWYGKRLFSKRKLTKRYRGC